MAWFSVPISSLPPLPIDMLTTQKHSLIPVAGPVENSLIIDGAGRKCPNAEMGHPRRVDLVTLGIILDFAPGNCNKLSRGIVHSIHFYATATERPFQIYIVD
jgi:hypothetical protein